VDRPLARPPLLDRRDLLRLSLLGASALALGARPAGDGQVRASGEGEAGEAAADRHRLPDRPAGPRSSRVAVVRSADFDSLREATRRAIALAGGLGFIRPGQTVLLKPAVNSGEPYPATTDPETVWTLAELVVRAGGQPFVADRTMFLKSTEKVFRETAIRDAAEEAASTSARPAPTAWATSPCPSRTTSASSTAPAACTCTFPGDSSSGWRRSGWWCALR
jgi:hypothetical protein